MDCVECEPGRREVQALHKGWGMGFVGRLTRGRTLTLWRLLAKQIRDRRRAFLPQASIPE